MSNKRFLIDGMNISAIVNVPEGSAYRHMNGKILPIREVWGTFVNLQDPETGVAIDFLQSEIIVPNIKFIIDVQRKLKNKSSNTVEEEKYQFLEQILRYQKQQIF